MGIFVEKGENMHGSNFSIGLMTLWMICSGLLCSAGPADHSDLSPEMRQRISPYLLPDSHPIKPALDAIFMDKRPTQDAHAFRKAGFTTLFNKKRTFICVAKHPNVPEYLFKIYLDDEKRTKSHKAGWEWLVQRCQGAEQVRRVIQENKIEHFVVPQKWLYVLPAEPTSTSSKHSRHQPLVLVVDDMKLASKEINLKAWRTLITEQHLDELFLIISQAKGRSYRPSNVWFNAKGQFCFIDTEYPLERSRFTSIRRYLNSEMRNYWDQLLKAKKKSRMRSEEKKLDAIILSQ